MPLPVPPRLPPCVLSQPPAAATVVEASEVRLAVLSAAHTPQTVSCSEGNTLTHSGLGLCVGSKGKLKVT